MLDDLSNGRQAYLHPAIQFTEGDVDSIPLLWTLLPDIDCVYHLAARVSVAQSILYPREYNRVNVGGTVSLMEAMRDTGVAPGCLSPRRGPYTAVSRNNLSHEDDTPQPDSPYAVSKWAAEQYIHTIGELWGLETVALRIFNAYGPRQSLPVSHAPVVPRFLQQALTGGSIVVFGDGQQSRDFVYVSDVVAALVSAATAKDVNRQVINIGSGIETTITELVNQIEQVTGKSVNRIANRSKGGWRVARLAADISRARMLLGFRPFVSLAEGLRLILQEDERFKANADK